MVSLSADGVACGQNTGLSTQTPKGEFVRRNVKTLKTSEENIDRPRQ